MGHVRRCTGWVGHAPAAPQSQYRTTRENGNQLVALNEHKLGRAGGRREAQRERAKEGTVASQCSGFLTFFMARSCGRGCVGRITASTWSPAATSRLSSPKPCGLKGSGERHPSRYHRHSTTRSRIASHTQPATCHTESRRTLPCLVSPPPGPADPSTCRL